MATILDLGLLEPFRAIFPALLVFALVFAILQKTSTLTKSVGINAIISVVTAFLILLSRTATDIINFMIPWFTVAIIFFILLLLIFQVFGAKEENIFKAVAGERGIIYVIIGIAIVIMIAAFGHVLGQNIGPYLEEGDNATTIIDSGSGVATSSFATNIWATLFHPKVLGIMILFAIMVFTVLLITSG